MKLIPLEKGNYYHIYNRGNNKMNLFFANENYIHFLRLYERYIDPIAETFAWCLMKNHFHILIYVKKDSEIDCSKLNQLATNNPNPISASKQFSNLFNAYTKAVNKRYKRTGSLFEKNFRRKIVTNESYFQKLIYYIHNNPVHHGFTTTIIEYPWTSYGTVLSAKPTKLQRKKVIDIFKDIDSFEYFHSIQQDLTEVEDLLTD